MILPAVLSNPYHRSRIILILAATLLTLGANCAGMLLGITAVLSHLLYFPIILVSYWYPRRGLFFSIAITAIYGFLSFLYVPSDSLLDIFTISRMALLIIVGAVVSLLAKNLAKSEQQLNDIIEFLPDATFAIDNKGNVEPGR